MCTLVYFSYSTPSFPPIQLSVNLMQRHQMFTLQTQQQHQQQMMTQTVLPRTMPTQPPMPLSTTTTVDSVLNGNLFNVEGHAVMPTTRKRNEHNEQDNNEQAGVEFTPGDDSEGFVESLKADVVEDCTHLSPPV